MADKKYASAASKNLGVGVDFHTRSEGDILTERPQFVGKGKYSTILKIAKQTHNFL